VQEELRRNVERFELIAKASNDALWEANVRTNEAWWSDRMFEILGYKPGEVVPSQEIWNSRLHPEDREKAAASVRQSLMPGGADSWTREYRFVRPDGEVRHVYARGIVSRDPEGRPLRILGSVTDLTEVKKAEADLRENEERYRRLVEVLPDVVAISVDGVLEFINQAGLTFRKTDSVDEMIGRHILEFFHPDDRPTVIERQKRLAAGEAVPPIQFRFLRADGSVIEAESRAIPFPYKGRNANLVVIRDVTERKRAEDALKRSEEHYRLLFHGSPQPMYLVDLDTLRFLDVNRAAEEQYGYSREEFLALTLRDIRPPEDIPFLEDKVRSLRSQKGNIGVWRHRRRDGGIIQAEVISHPLETHDNPNACITIALDVTDKLEAVEKLRHSEERYRTLAKVSPVGLFRTDLRGSWLYVNEHCVHITGLAPDRLEGHAWMECIHPDDRERVRGDWERTLTLDQAFQSEFRFVRPDGKPVWVLGRALTDRDAQGAPIGYVGTLTDITERKQAETLLAGQKRTLAMVASGWALKDVLESLLQYAEKECPGMSAGLLLLDPEARTFSWASAMSLPAPLRAAFEGLPAAPEAGAPGFACADRRMAVVADLEGGPEAPGRKQALEAGYRACAAMPILGSYGGVLGAMTFWFRKPGNPPPFYVKLLETASDLAAIAVERRRQEETTRQIQELSEENHRILEANRMKSEFMASMSHELRTPLNAIIGFSQLLIDRKVGQLNEKQAEYMGDILDGGMLLLRLINDVLDLAKIESGKMQLFPEPISVPRAIREVCDILMPMALAKGIAFRIDADGVQGDVNLDSQKFKQVLYNLVSNAIKFSGQGAPVLISAVLGADGELRLKVTDQGIGIKREDIHKLFQEFQQLDSGAARHFPGTGLGLVITKKLVELHRGTVGVESEAGKGSSFFATFPALKAEDD
jgi:PAS domain S-box-containing protein